MTGTALLGLDKLSRNHPEFGREQIGARHAGFGIR